MRLLRGRRVTATQPHLYVRMARTVGRAPEQWCSLKVVHQPRSNSVNSARTCSSTKPQSCVLSAVYGQRPPSAPPSHTQARVTSIWSNLTVLVTAFVHADLQTNSVGCSHQQHLRSYSGLSDRAEPSDRSPLSAACASCHPSCSHTRFWLAHWMRLVLTPESLLVR